MLTQSPAKALASAIAAREQAERALSIAEHARDQATALLSTVIEIVPGLIYARDRSGRLLFANKASLALIGDQDPDIEGRAFDQALDERLADQMKQSNAVGDLVNGDTAYEMEELIEHPEKGPRIYLSTKVPFHDFNNEMAGTVVLSTDITERKAIAKELLHVSRRTAMGDMATAIAHEINQPLAAIGLYLNGSTALLENDGYVGPLTQSLGLAKEQCLRAGEIIRKVRSFVSDGDHVKRPENVSLLVDEACSLALLGSRDDGVSTSIKHVSADNPVLVDRVQIEQVIVNLVRNAMDAMGDVRGGALRITTGHNEDGMAMVSVSDSGPGISAAVLSRLFEPFVSTKGVEGMGVGLSICRTIVEGHGGRIWADAAAAGRGATFHFTLPALGDMTAA